MGLSQTSILDEIPMIDRMIPQRLETALFGMGCFLRGEAQFGLTRGIWRTLVGYAGGNYASPTYNDAGDQIEVIFVEYDPLTISYGQLLELFLRWHACSETEVLPEYASSIFVKNEGERRLAQAAVERYNFSSEDLALTRIMAFKTFRLAERWCQKYFLRISPWFMPELRFFYNDEDVLVRSTLAMRLNGILGLSPSAFLLPDSIDTYGLSEHAVQVLKRMMTV